jgi:esterase/lipase
MYKALKFFVLAAFFALPAQANDLKNLSLELDKKEQAVPERKEKASAFFLFANPENPQPTDVAFLYIHGFSASPKESSPLVENLAQITGSNAYFPRLTGHGIANREAMRNVKLEDWQKDTKEAFQVGRRLGKKLVVVAMSMGGALVIPEILQNPSDAVILLSPNFRLKNWISELLQFPFGLWLAKWNFGEYRQWKAISAEQEYFWSTSYPTEILVELVKSAKTSRDQEVEKIQTPLLLAYSEKDPTSSTREMKEIFSRWGSVHKTIFESQSPNADPHNIAGEILSKENTPNVQKAALDFLMDKKIISTPIVESNK